MPFRFIARLLFSDVRLERDGKNLHIRIAATAPGVGPHELADKAIAAAAPLKTALNKLLDSHRMTRQVMRHLAYLEKALATQGFQALSEVPVEVLVASLEQLDSIISNWSNHHLAELRSKMAVAVMERSRDSFRGATGEQLSNFATESRLEVADASHSLFIELERQYKGLVPRATIEAALSSANRKSKQIDESLACRATGATSVALT